MACARRRLDEDGRLSGFWELEGGLAACGRRAIPKSLEVHALRSGYGVVPLWGASKHHDLASLSTLGYLGEDVPDPHRIGVDQGVVEDHRHSIVGVNEPSGGQPDEVPTVRGPLTTAGPIPAGSH